MPPTARGARRQPARHSLSDQLAAAIADRGLTAYAVAKLAGIDPGIVARFLAGRRDLRLATADKLAATLGLRLIDVAPRRGRPAPRTTGRGMPIAAASADGPGVAPVRNTDASPSGPDPDGSAD